MSEIKLWRVTRFSDLDANVPVPDWYNESSVIAAETPQEASMLVLDSMLVRASSNAENTPVALHMIPILNASGYSNPHITSERKYEANAFNELWDYNDVTTILIPKDDDT